MIDHQRTFVILGHAASITPDFTLNDLPGSAGRMDILARCITTSFCLSHGIRKDVAVYLILRDQLTLRFDGATVKRLNPDERSTGALIKHAIESAQRLNIADQAEEIESTPGVYVARRGLRVLLEFFAKTNILCHVLDEHGTDIRSAPVQQPVAFVLSDHQNFSPDEELLLKECTKVSLGPVVLHADHCISVVHNELDRRSLHS
ncbi:tRNA (pseudouridine(54)-N(1))-methyltransferase TrmY [Candidatus Acetothermia bacterium]|nr:tRNA (pseudouridine(54)-N(1))-methyltransferase TrmY [Candidatus Acetothermia bacterium]MBI3643270.1 tRNA (pseudouridine(54)-N(1))-methyltransferase TrmY [Candidatus Acetothermia bacterium]